MHCICLFIYRVNCTPVQDHKIAGHNHISITVTDTTLELVKVEWEVTHGLSIGTFDPAWPWTVLVQGHQKCTSNISKMITGTDSIWQTPEFAWTLSCSYRNGIKHVWYSIQLAILTNSLLVCALNVCFILYVSLYCCLCGIINDDNDGRPILSRAGKHVLSFSVVFLPDHCRNERL